jgi:hypothetical protein
LVANFRIKHKFFIVLSSIGLSIRVTYGKRPLVQPTNPPDYRRKRHTQANVAMPAPPRDQTGTRAGQEDDVPGHGGMTTSDTSGGRARLQVIKAPDRPHITGLRSIFLAGTTSRDDWREPFTAALSHLPVTVFNPLRLDWDRSWIEHPSFEPFREQVEWELDMQHSADLVAIYFGSGTDAPISLLELGLHARTGKVVVACDKDYRKAGNVQILCNKYGIDMVDDRDGLAEAVLKKLEADGIR